jgi:hypothetical protein
VDSVTRGNMEPYTTGTGQHINVHDEAACKGSHCVIHNPSNHHMVDWPTHWRDDRKLMERKCTHGIGHPDPDHIGNLAENLREWESVHGCDGCCLTPRDERESNP